MSLKKRFKRKKKAVHLSNKPTLNGAVEIDQGLRLLQSGKFLEAELIFNAVAAQFPKNENALIAKGMLDGERDRHEDAIALFKKALSINSGNISALYNLGLALRVMGRLDESRVCFEKAVMIQPDSAVNHFMLSSLKKYTDKDKHILIMEKLFSRQHINDEDKMHLAYALGKAYEDSGIFEKAFDYYTIANKIERKPLIYSKDKMQAEFELIKNTFNESFISRNLQSGNPDDTPIFIVGMMRSGSSLIEQILASHPDVYGAGEVKYFSQELSHLSGSDSIEKICAAISTGDEEIISKAGTGYIEKLRRFSGEEKFITDKFLHNFLWIGAIFLALPNAKIVYCSRDPIDICLSIYKNRFVQGHPYAYDLSELGHYLLLHEDLMSYWNKVFPGKIYNISYEKLVSDQESETLKLLEYCNLPWNEECLSFHKNLRAVNTVSVTQVRKPIYKDSAQLWKRYEKQLQPLKEIFSRGL